MGEKFPCQRVRYRYARGAFCTPGTRVNTCTHCVQCVLLCDTRTHKKSSLRRIIMKTTAERQRIHIYVMEHVDINIDAESMKLRFSAVSNLFFIFIVLNLHIFFLLIYIFVYYAVLLHFKHTLILTVIGVCNALIECDGLLKMH